MVEQNIYSGIKQDDIDPRDKLWDRWAPDYQSFLRLNETREAWDSFINLVPATEEQVRFLDGGCGDGEIIEGLVRRMPNGWITGLDKSEEFLQRTGTRIIRKFSEQEAERVDLVRADLAKSLPFPDETFDGVTMNFVFQYLSEEEQKSCLGEMARVIKPGGKIYISTFVDNRSFKEVAPSVIGRNFLRGNVVGAVRALSKLPITIQFDRLRKQGYMNHPFVVELEEMHREAGFSDFKIADRLFKGIEVISIATR